MNHRWIICCLLSIVSVALEAAVVFHLETAPNHSMSYYHALPQGWTAAKKWPIGMVIESANREFQSNLYEFVQARRDLPFILVAPNGRF